MSRTWGTHRSNIPAASRCQATWPPEEDAGMAGVSARVFEIVGSDRFARQAAVDPQIVARHRRGRKAAFKFKANLVAIEYGYLLHRLDRLVLGIDDPPGDAVAENLRYRPAIPGNHRRAAGHGLDHDQPEGLGPVDRKEQRER